jgi:hypothetical protein
VRRKSNQIKHEKNTTTTTKRTNKQTKNRRKKKNNYNQLIKIKKQNIQQL